MVKTNVSAELRGIGGVMWEGGGRGEGGGGDLIVGYTPNNTPCRL